MNLTKYQNLATTITEKKMSNKVEMFVYKS